MPPLTPPPSPPPRLILGSSSPYRQELLERLGLAFHVMRPEVDETPLPGEAPAELSLRLAMAKAHAVAAACSPEDIVVIGSDQVADLSGNPIGKPGHHQAAVHQLQSMRGQTVRFHTAVAVIRPHTGFAKVERVEVQVRFRSAEEGLSDAALEAYLRAEKPYDCAGSAKSEGLGIALLQAIHSNDPTALIGLPLIRTCALLREAGLDVLLHSAATQAPQP
jgi:septum formation protein